MALMNPVYEILPDFPWQFWRIFRVTHGLSACSQESQLLKQSKRAELSKLIHFAISDAKILMILSSIFPFEEEIMFITPSKFATSQKI